jgi:membrane peptidoglycan carboxypeptidase
MNSVRVPGPTAPRQRTRPCSQPPQLATSVWVGDSHAPVPMANLFAGGLVVEGTFPAPIFRHYMAAALAGQLVADPPGASPAPHLGAT